MPSKLQLYMQMADEAQRQITGSYQGWTGFLSTAARLYKYPYIQKSILQSMRATSSSTRQQRKPLMTLDLKSSPQSRA